MSRKVRSEEQARRVLLGKLYHRKPGMAVRIIIGHCPRTDSLGLLSLQAIAERVARVMVEQEQSAHHQHVVTYFVTLAGDVPGYAVLAGIKKRRNTPARA